MWTNTLRVCIVIVIVCFLLIFCQKFWPANGQDYGVEQHESAKQGSDVGFLHAIESVQVSATTEEKVIVYTWEPINCGGWHVSSGGSRGGNYWAQNNSNLDSSSVVADCHLDFTPPGEGWVAIAARSRWWTSKIDQDGEHRNYQIESLGIFPTFGWTTTTAQEPDAYEEWHELQLDWPPALAGLRMVAYGGSKDWIGFSDASLTITYVRESATETPTPTQTPTNVPIETPTPTVSPTATATSTPSPIPTFEPITVCNQVIAELDENFGDVVSANFWETRQLTDTVSGQMAIVNVWKPQPVVQTAVEGYNAPIVLEAVVPDGFSEIEVRGFYRGTSTSESERDFLSVNIQVGTQVLKNETLLYANSLDEWNRWREWEYRFPVNAGQIVRLEVFVHSQDWATSWFELDGVTINSCQKEDIGQPTIIEPGPIDQIYGGTAEQLASMGLILVSHGTSAYTTEFGKGLYSIDYMWRTSALHDFPAHVFGGRPYPGVVQRGPNVPFEDGMWVTSKADMAWKMAMRCVQQRCWTPERNQELIQALQRIESANTWAGRDLLAIQRQISVLQARAAIYQSLTAEQLALLERPIVGVWRLHPDQLITFLEKSKKGTMVVKDGYLLWKDVYAIEFPANTPQSIIDRVYRNIRQSGAPTSVKLIVGNVEVQSRYWRDYLPNIVGTTAAIRTFGGSVLTWTVNWGKSLAAPVGAGMSQLGAAGVIEAAIAANLIVGSGSAIHDGWQWYEMESWQTNVRPEDYVVSNNLLWEVYAPSVVEWRSSPVTSEPSPVVVEIPQHGVPYQGRGVPGYMPIPASQSFIWMRVKEVRNDHLVIELLDEPQLQQFVVRREIELGKDILDGTYLTYWIEDPQAGMMSMTFDIRLWKYEWGEAEIEVRWSHTRAPEDYGCRPGWKPSLGESCLIFSYLPAIEQ